MLIGNEIVNLKIKARQQINQICIDHDFDDVICRDSKIIFDNESGICYLDWNLSSKNKI